MTAFIPFGSTVNQTLVGNYYNGDDITHRIKDSSERIKLAQGLNNHRFCLHWVGACGFAMVWHSSLQRATY